MKTVSKKSEKTAVKTVRSSAAKSAKPSAATHRAKTAKKNASTAKKTASRKMTAADHKKATNASKLAWVSIHKYRALADRAVKNGAKKYNAKTMKFAESYFDGAIARASSK